jgi:L-lysine exporter family protein LysE/ArgO
VGIESAGFEGFAISISLIFALGPQNVFILRQGLMKSHVFISCLVCSISDALLIAGGVLGVGLFLSEIDGVEIWISIVAALFLVCYGCLRIKSSLNPEGMEIGSKEEKNMGKTVLTALAFTYLNPHVYVDTLLLVGAATASFVFFFSLGYGAKLMSPILNNPHSWKIIDLAIATIMFVIAGFIIAPHSQTILELF